MKWRPVIMLLGGLACAPPTVLADRAAERFVLAWPPTRYQQAELIAWQQPETAVPGLRLRVRGRGIDLEAVLPADRALRVPLPLESRCEEGVDSCGLLVEALDPGLRFHLALQSPDTAGEPDTLLRSAHDTVRAPPPSAAGLEHLVQSYPNAPDFPLGRSFASLIPVDGATRAWTAGGCAGAWDEVLTFPEVLTLSCAGEGEDLSGALVQSDRPSLLWSGNVVTQVPVSQGSGLSADLLMDAPPSLDHLSQDSTWLIPPLPKPSAGEGRGDLVRILAAGEGATVRVRDDQGGDETRMLAGGELWEIDTAGSPGDRVLRVDAEGKLSCWQLSKSWALRGSGDGAAVPLVPLGQFTHSDSFFVPDGYNQEPTLILVSESVTGLRLDGQLVGGFEAGPVGELWWTRLSLPRPGAGTGALFSLSGEAGLGAWLFGQGGYKAHALAAARAMPLALGPELHRGTEPQALSMLTRPEGSSYEERESGTWFYSVEADVDLRLRREGASVHLSWSP